MRALLRHGGLDHAAATGGLVAGIGAEADLDRVAGQQAIGVALGQDDARGEAPVTDVGLELGERVGALHGPPASGPPSGAYRPTRGSKAPPNWRPTTTMMMSGRTTMKNSPSRSRTRRTRFAQARR
jgi:hypothetical protein